MSEGIWTMGRVESGVAPFPGVSDNFQRSASGVAAGTAGISISVKPGRFYSAVIQNAGATAYFVLVFDKATPPVNGDVPVLTRRLKASDECLIDMNGVNGIPCQTGIGIALSTTAGTLTLAIAADIAFRTVVYTASK